MKKVKGFRRKKHIDTDNSVVTARGKAGWGEVEEAKEGEMVMEGDLTLGGECIMQCAEDVL